MKKSKYFRLEEFLTSSTARQKSIENIPSWEVIEHLNELALFLDGLRASWGSGIIISSGFRCDKLNAAVGGVPNSVHKIGYAADLQPANGDIEGFKRFVANWVQGKAFDQCIIERKGKTEWIHLSIRGNNGKQRRQVFSLTA
jgi:hypothetical protein